MTEKIYWENNLFTIDIPEGKSGEYYVICPICTPRRKPEHQKEKKLSVNLSKPEHPWRCKHCDAAGVIISDNYVNSLKIKPYFEPVQSSKPSDGILAYFKNKRGISEVTLKHFKAYASKESMYLANVPEQLTSFKGQWKLMDCIQIRYEYRAFLINIKYRDRFKNFKLISGADLTLYNINAILDKSVTTAIITEGELDVWAYYEAGINNVVSVPNGSTISDEEKESYYKTGEMTIKRPLNLSYLDNVIDELSHIQTFILATDDDPTGIKLRLSLADRLGKDKCKYIKFSKHKRKDGSACKDPNDVLLANGKEALANTLNETISFPVDGVSTSKMYVDSIINRYDNGVQIGKSTGYKSLDPYWRWVDGWLYIMNGWPNHGKTGFFLNLAVVAAAIYDWKICLYSPENYPVEQIIEQITEIYLGNTITRSEKRIKKSEVVELVNGFIDDHFFFVEDRAKGYTPAELRKIKETMIRQYGVKMFFTDPWKNLVHKNTGSIDEYIRQEINQEVRFATSNNVINVISHHPRTPDKAGDELKPPGPFSMVGGQIWNASAYHQEVIQRDDIFDRNNTFTQIHVQKSKIMKIGGIWTAKDNPVKLRFDRKSNRFYEKSNLHDANGAYNRFPIDTDKFIYQQKEILGF